MALHVIVGKGPVGTTTAEQLAARGHEVRVLSRSGGSSAGAVEHRRVDASDATATTETFGLTATPWPEVVAATAGAVGAVGMPGAAA